MTAPPHQLGRDDVSAWRRFADQAVAALDESWRQRGSVVFWTKPQDDSPVSDLELRIDAELRRLLHRHFPRATVVSEELGTLLPMADVDPATTVLIDPVDGTTSLRAGRDDWWVAVAILRHGAPTFGLLHQPHRRAGYDSSRPTVPAAGPTGLVGCNPVHLDPPDRVGKALRGFGLTPVAVPHAADKVVAVLDGRCDGALFVPTAQTPDWRAWDLAAAAALARVNGLLLVDLHGQPLRFDERGDRQRTGWACARERRTLRDLIAAGRTRDRALAP